MTQPPFSAYVSAKPVHPSRTDSEFFRAKLSRVTYLHLLRICESLPDTQLNPSVHLLGNALLLTCQPQPDLLRRCMAQLITGDYPILESTQTDDSEGLTDFKLVLNKASFDRIEVIRDELRQSIQARPDVHMFCNAMLLTAAVEPTQLKSSIAKMILGEAH